LAAIGYIVAATSPADHRTFGPVVYPRDRALLLSFTVALSGVVGGTAFALKWLYHSVAKWTWNRDRVWWRLIVPALSGILALFVSALVTTGVMSVFNPKFFTNFFGALGGGFFVGYFSDNVLAALQNLAMKWFGTVDKRYQVRFPGHRSEVPGQENTNGGNAAAPQVRESTSPGIPSSGTEAP